MQQRSPTPEPRHGDGFSASTYGTSFADVYDAWYPPDATTAATVAAVLATAGAGSRVLELGVGTGRLALALSAAGVDVVGLDASPEMLDALRAKDPSLPAVLGDVADPTVWPVGPFDLVLAACNLVCNLPGSDAQASMFRSAADALAPGGTLVVETFEPAPLAARTLGLELRSVDADAVTLIATDTDPDSGVVTGQHIELRDGAPVKLRPWRITLVHQDQLDTWATAAGLVLERRDAGWERGEPDDGARIVSWYRRPTTATT